MLIFFSVLLCFICFFDYVNIEKIYKTTLLFISLFILLFLGGGRYEFAGAGDWFIYKDYFEQAPAFGEYNEIKPIYLFFEPGYFLFNCFVKLYTHSYVVFFLSLEFFSLTLFYLSIKKYTQYPLIAVLLYYPLLFLSLDLIAIRSLIAVQIFLFSISYIVDKKLLKYTVAILIATSFHYSAIILLPMYFILNKTYESKTIISVIFVGVLLIVLRIDLLTPLLQYLPITKVSEYTNGDISGPTGFSIKHIEYLFYLSLLIKYRNELFLKKKKWFNVFLNMFFFYGILIFYFFGVNAFAGRLKFFFLSSLVVLVSYLVSLTIKKKLFYISYFALCMYVVLIMIYMFYIRDDGYFFLDYKNYFLEV